MALHLHFQKDAIVTFSLSNGYFVTGRVTRVDQNEVEFIPQYFFADCKKKQSCCVDAPPERHLDRNAIVMWGYKKLPDIEDLLCYKKYDYGGEGTNVFDNDGLFKGHGDFFE